MGCALHQVHILGSNLARLGNLQLLAALLVAYPEGTTTRLALVLHHTAHTHRTVERADNQLARRTLGQSAAQLVAQEVGSLSLLILATLKGAQQLESLVLQAEQLTSQHLLIGHRVGLARVGSYIVDILHKNHISIQRVQVGKQCAVTCGTEEQLTLSSAEGGVVGIHSDSIGCGALLRETDVELLAKLLLIEALTLSQKCLKTSLMLGRNGEVDGCLVAIASVERSLHKVLLDGLACAIGVGVEGNQTLGLFAVAQAVDDDILHHLLILALGTNIVA